MRGALAGCFDLVGDCDAVAGVVGAVVEGGGVETARGGADGGAGVLEGWGLGVAAAVVGEDVVETHGWVWMRVLLVEGFAGGWWVG